MSNSDVQRAFKNVVMAMNMYQTISRSPQARFKDKTSWEHSQFQWRHTTCHKRHMWKSWENREVLHGWGGWRWIKKILLCRHLSIQHIELGKHALTHSELCVCMCLSFYSNREWGFLEKLNDIRKCPLLDLWASFYTSRSLEKQVTKQSFYLGGEMSSTSTAIDIAT